MATPSGTERSSELIETEDLARLADIAETERADLLESEQSAPSRERVLCFALCQGAALHYGDGANGVKDFDLYTFFAGITGRSGSFDRTPRQRDDGPSKFGRNPNDFDVFTGRRVDLFWRTLDADVDSDPAEVIQACLRHARKDSTPWYLARKAVVLLRPKARLGEVVWSLDPAT